MKKQSTWRFVVKIVGASLAVAGFVCLLVAYWDKLTNFFGGICNKCRDARSCPEFDDYADDLMFQFE